MKVILKQDVKKLGKKEQMIEVSDGYARNYLLPKKIAVEATAANINVMQTKKSAEESKQIRDMEKANEVKANLDGKIIAFQFKASESGKLFGSVGASEIAEKVMKEFRLEVDKRKIVLDGAIKTIGDTEVGVKLYPSVVAKVIVRIKAE